ncbi:26S proteasome non-ATPase regulatory subunit 9 isoform X2 [Bombus affinis]|uniref:26S proteasome non-ATPase regulatory subunit 9 isoform X2 n=1 Tax=Bombus affinis TaxID=309941 RepID=UPI0021B7C11D|nr:26S proteasome non-ATPase regulatory subunit 9 isoform X2 [Bombus affinis]
MVVDMELQEAKDYILQLMKDKDKIESDLKALKEILDISHVGMDDPLVDCEGYPRNDIDVYQVRHVRYKIICLRNDHKTLMKKMEEGLHKLHAVARGQAESSLATTTIVQDNAQLDPFLKVNLVSSGSPAEIALVCQIRRCNVNHVRDQDIYTPRAGWCHDRHTSNPMHR